MSNLKTLALIATLESQGFHLGVRGSNLEVRRNPPRALSPPLRQQLLAHKPELLHALRMRATRELLLEICGSLGLPDALVDELPESEIAATVDQYENFTAAKGDELGRKLLVFYLRSLVGIEPALPGSLAERDAPNRQAHV